jgi:hypothetical protein
MIALYRPRELQLNEKRWVKQALDSRLAMSLDIDIVSTNSVTEALSHPVIVILGPQAHSVFHNTPIASGISTRGQILAVGDKTTVTTWDVSDVIKDDHRAKEFLSDMLKARVYFYGLGNRNTGYLESVRMTGSDGQDEIFTIDQFEKMVSVFEVTC